MNKKEDNLFQDLMDIDELEDIELYQDELEDELNEDYEEHEKDEEEAPWELIEDIDGLSELLEDEENLEEYFVEEFPGLYRLKKRN